MIIQQNNKTISVTVIDNNQNLLHSTD